MTYTTHLTIVTLVALMLSNSRGDDNSKGKSVKIVPTGIVFSEKVSERNGLCDGPKDCWFPQEVDVINLEKNFSVFLRKSSEPGAKYIRENLKSYKRKYFGYLKGGDRWISVVGICSMFWHPNDINFQSLKRPATDLGTCFFEADYNVTTGKFVELYIDGEA